ncbi:centrosomal protein of 78 kDa-like [Apis mellifera caucasica]|uniref:Centrosomal protein of 78 kDa-like n=1 Tax=Apis mellifera TaxID=7460 RepID=A0A7M7GZV7_APIME|nr:centrosomal protein of 78 kDa-like [Apis mellifera]KAG6795345.1 centrosomal protein of 78 kDa-like [Apis mellifera caucasica]|eukprot:XP_006571076.1 centrosomal protein of 78 kDa-like [Apis mellifera]
MAIPNSRNFANCYMELCKQQRLRPLPVICVTLPHSLDFTTDRVKMDDWGPILNSLSLDRSLRSISVRSRYQCRKPLEEINSEDKARTMGKAPVVLSRYLLEWLSHSVAQCVRNSPVLTNLELEGIPFPPDCLAVLCVGLSHTHTLHYLSLQRCYIGDSSCEVLCRTVADVPSVRSLNLSYCDLTCKCGPALAAALCRQKLLLYHDTWKQSLRYQEPNLEAMPGLRRLTLNDNPQLGDAAIMELIEAVRDSLWLKALDLQRCGLTDKIGKDLLELLDHNTTLSILDVRQNVNLNEALVNEVIKRLEENNGDSKTEYRWLGLPQHDRRVVSAGSGNRNENEDHRKPPIRPRSTEYNKGPYAARRMVNQSNARKMKMRPHVPPYKTTRQLQQQEQQHIVQNGQPKSKISLHLDLQSHIQPVMGEGQNNVPSYVDSIQADTDRSSSKNLEIIKIDVGVQVEDEEMENSTKIQKIQFQLSEAKAEHDRLIEEARRSGIMLADERGRREAAEEQLNAMKGNLTELENALEEKERETSGYLLLSQQSLEEICSSFDRLLNMLDNMTKNPNTNRRESTEAAIVRADIKRRVASVIRETKSENLRRGFIIDDDDSIRYTEPIKKFAKSESDMRSALPPISTLHLERNIGDSPDIGSPTLQRVLLHEKDSLSPRARARALFAQIIQGNTVLDFCTHID